MQRKTFSPLFAFLALWLSSYFFVSANQHSSAQAVQNSAELLRRQQILLQSEMLRQESQKPDSPAENSKYGLVTGTIERIESLMNNASKTLGATGYDEFKSRLDAVKDFCSIEIARRGDASNVLQAARSLEADLNYRIRDAAQLRQIERTKVEAEVERLEKLFNDRSAKLGDRERAELGAAVGAIRARLDKLPAVPEQPLFDALLNDSRALQSRILSLVILSAHASISQEPEERAVSSENISRNSGVLPETRHGGAASRRNSTVYGRNKKTVLSIPVLIERIENELLNMHEKHQLGSFDIDSYSQNLLVVKRNIHEMMSGTGRLSPRQEKLVRQELAQLDENIRDRVGGHR